MPKQRNNSKRAIVGIDIFSVVRRSMYRRNDWQGVRRSDKRHHFSSNRATHGNSVSTNAPGSIGMRRSGRVMPGKRMGAIWATNSARHRTWSSRESTRAATVAYSRCSAGAAGGDVVVRPAAKAKPVQATKAESK